MNSDIFTIISIFLILLNTAILACDSYPIDKDLESFLESANMFFTVWFMIDLLLKLFGDGLKEFLKDTFNIFDTIVVTLSIAELVIDQTNIFNSQGVSSGGSISGFRTLRLLRILKLAR